MRIEKLKAEHNVKVEWVHFPLHPEKPAEGRSLADLFAGRQVDRKAMHAQMKARMDAAGLPYGERTMTYNSRLAQELGKWADTQPGGEALHDALFRAYFVEARDISQPAVLLDIVDTRWAEHRPMVITANADPSHLDTAVGDRIASRLLDSVRVAFLGEDRRGGAL